MTIPPLRRLLLAIVLLGFAGGAGAGGIVRDAAATLMAIVVAVDIARAMRRGVLGVDVIALLSIVGAVALGEHLAAVIIALMVAGGSALDEFAEARARHELAALVGRTPHIAHRLEADHVADVPVASISPNDLLLIKPGEIVPVDGMVETEAATLDELALTGEPVPLMRAHGLILPSCAPDVIWRHQHYGEADLASRAFELFDDRAPSVGLLHQDDGFQPELF